MSIKKNLNYTKIFKRIFLFIFILTIGFIGFILNESKDDINANLDNIDEKLNHFYKPSKLGGFAVCLFNEDSIIYKNGFGYSDHQKKRAYTTETQQFIASISKTVIAVALMKAEEMNLLDLSDPINKHLPFSVSNPAFPEAKITIKHLATHTSSLSYNEDVVESLYITEPEKAKSIDEFMFDYFDRAVYGEVSFSNHEPGKNWDYSNIGSALAAYIIEQASGIAFSEFTKKHIFEPLQLNHTYWYESESDSLNYTAYFEPKQNSIIPVKSSGIILYPCRDMITDIKDLTTFCQAIMSKNPALLTKQSYDKLLSPQLDGSVTNFSDDHQAIFFSIDRNNFGIPYQLTGHDGGDYCIQTMMSFDQKTNLGYIFIGNTGFSAANRSNHILIYNALVSLGDQYTFDNKNLIGKVKFRIYNYYRRINSLF